MLEFLLSLGFVTLILYLIPAVIAYAREDVLCRFDVFIVNLLFGWTVIGWWWALYMAVTYESRSDIARLYGLADD